MDWDQISQILHRDRELRKKKELNYKSVLFLYFLNFLFAYSDKSLIISHRACLSKPHCLSVCVFPEVLNF